MRESIRDGYKFKNLRSDIMAGLVVGIVALPLSMALAIASGVPPQHGLYTAIIAGGLIAVCGGSRLNVSGPTAAFVVLLAPVSAKFGVGGLALASLLAGVILLVAGFARLGRLVSFVPHPVTTGFTGGIAVVIATLQLRDFFGLDVAPGAEHYWERIRALMEAAPSFHWPDFAVGALTLSVLIVWPKITRKVPGPLVAILAGTLVALALSEWGGEQVATIGTRFNGIPALPPMPLLPWDLPGADGEPIGISFELLKELGGPALAIAALGAIESLLAAVVADGMAGTRHDPDSELVGQGLGNIVAPFFGGFAATGAIARTATNIRAGGRTPVAAIVHALFLLVAVLALAPVLSYLPMAALAALLLIVAWNMSYARHFLHSVRVAPRSDVAVLLACFGLTVLFDMVVAVGVGIVMAALLFMRRMAELSGSRMVGNGAAASREDLPEGVIIYEIAGPLFFGAADKAVGGIATSGELDLLVLDMHAVPAMDSTGLVAFESLLKRMKSQGTRVALAGVNAQPLEVLERAHITAKPGELSFHKDVAAALKA